MTRAPASSRVSGAARNRDDALRDLLLRIGFDCAAGVPDSGLAGVMARLENVLPVYIAPREDVAVAVACGLALAGRRPMVYMKNAGMLTCGDALLSLARDIGIGVFLLVGWAGAGDDVLAHHVVSGQSTTPVLEGLGVQWEAFTHSSPSSGDRIAARARACRDSREHFALLVVPEPHRGG